MPETVGTAKRPWEMISDEFEEYVIGGKLHQQDYETKLPGEDEAETWLRLGLINAYPEKDIAYFYSLRSNGQKAGYLRYIADAIYEGLNVPDGVVHQIISDWQTEGGGMKDDGVCQVYRNWAMKNGIFPRKSKARK